MLKNSHALLIMRETRAEILPAAYAFLDFVRKERAYRGLQVLTIRGEDVDKTVDFKKDGEFWYWRGLYWIMAEPCICPIEWGQLQDQWMHKNLMKKLENREYLKNEK